MKQVTSLTCAALLLASTSSFGDTKKSKAELLNGQIEELLVLESRKGNFTEITEEAQKLVSMPGAMGDPLGAITALPGILNTGSGEPAVRGSSPADNRYYIDGMPTSYIFHNFNTSIFDENVVQDFQLYSAGFGAQYTNATGAVFDIRLRDPEHKPIAFTVNASLLRAGVFAEGEVTENSAFYLSVRQGLLQYFLPEDDEPDDEGIRIKAPPADNDYLFKYVWDINDNQSFSINLAGAGDYIEAELTDLSDIVLENPDFAGDAKIDDGFDSQSVKWRYSTDTNNEFELRVARHNESETLEWGQDYFNTIESTNTFIHGHYRHHLSDTHTVTLGSEYSKQKFQANAHLVLFVCTEFDNDCQAGRRDVIDESIHFPVEERTLYLTDNWQVSDTVNIESGLQWNSNNFTHEKFVNPRLALTWEPLETLTLSATAGRYNRFPDIDTILPSIGNPLLKSPQAEHFTLGMKGDMSDHWNWSIEAYHKELTQLPLGLSESEPDSHLLYSNDIEGTATGFEVFANKNLSDKWYGWVSLSYAKSERTNLRTRESRTWTFDTPIVLNVVGNYQLTQKWNAGFRFSARSGQPTTEIIGIKPNPNYPEGYLPVYGEPYAKRHPVFAQLDLRFEREMTLFGNEGSWFIDIINALNRENITEEKLDYKKVNETGELHTTSDAEMGIFPSVGITVTF